MNETTEHYQLEFEPSSLVEIRMDTGHGVLEAGESLDVSVGDYGDTVTLAANPSWDGTASATLEMSAGEAKQLAECLLAAAENGKDSAENVDEVER